MFNMWNARSSSILAWLRPSPILVILLLNLAIANSVFAPSMLADESHPATELSWTSFDGKKVEWKPDSKLRVVAFLGCDCPVAKLYARRIEELQTRFAPRGVEWVGVMSNQHDSIEDITRFTKELGLSFPLVKDTEQSLASQWKISRTAEVVLVDPTGTIHYRGRIDDQYAPGISKSKVAREDLALSIESVLDGKQPQIAITEPVGCKIALEINRKSSQPEQASGEREVATPTYANSVAAILNKHCTECHRPGEIGPFDITDIAELPGWSEMILEVIDNGRMPPWHADPKHGSFKNTRAISREEIETIRQWVRGGAPIGEASDLQMPKFAASGWRLDREPELIVPMREQPYKIPATGTVDYQYFVVDPHLKEDRWVSAAQVIPGDPSVVHHAIVFIRPPDDAEFLGIGWLTAYVPGQMATRFPPGYARKIPAGSKFVFQMHYTPNGRATTDLSKIGMTFVDSSQVTNEVYTVVGIDQDFEIPPGATDHRVTARVPRFPKDGELLAVSPHMHLRGKSFELRAVRGSDEEILLNVPRYDFNWQHTYEWTDRIELADVDALNFTVAFDNSHDNPSNPDADEFVMWGDQTWEEMAVAFFEVARPLQLSDSNVAARSISQRSVNLTTPRSENPTIPRSEPPNAESPAAAAFADEYIGKWDANGDGVVGWEEAPKIQRDFGFSRIDSDGNRVLTREELIRASRKRDR
jgi:peroxiredoxin